jgi:hypothetical protein
MTVEMEESIRKNRTVDIDDQTGFLAEILKSRKSARKVFLAMVRDCELEWARRDHS